MQGEPLEFDAGSKTIIDEKFPDGNYTDVAGLCGVATVEEIEAQGWSLNPGRYVPLSVDVLSDEDHATAMERARNEFTVLTQEAEGLASAVAAVLNI